MDYTNRQPPRPGVRRIALNVNLSPEIHAELGQIAAGNRSAAIELLVREHVTRRERRARSAPIPEPAP